MNNSASNRLTWLAIPIAIMIMGALVDPAAAQQRYNESRPRFQAMQYEQPVPDVSLPAPSFEGDPYPMADELTPMVDQYVEGLQGDILDDTVLNETIDQGVVSEGVILEPTVETPSYFEPTNQPAPIYSTGSWFRQGQYYTRFDFLYWTKDDTESPAINSGNRTNVFGNVVNNTLDNLVDHYFRPGIRFSAGRFLGRDTVGRDHMIEATFLGFFEWDDSRTVFSRAGGGINTALAGIADVDQFTPSFFNNDSQTVSYGADFDSIEANYQIMTRPGRDQMAMQPDGRWVRRGVSSQMRSLLAGMRVMSFNDSIRITSQTAGALTATETIDAVTNVPTVDPQTVIPDFVNGEYRVTGHNDLIGFQLGGSFQERHDEWGFSAHGKIGGFANLASRRSRLRAVQRTRTVVSTRQEQAFDANGDPIRVDANGVPTDDGTGTLLTNTVNELEFVGAFEDLVQGVNDETFSFMAEFGFAGNYQLRPNLHLRAGYDFLLLTNITSAPENLGLVNGFPNFDLNGTVLLHGATIGLEGTW